MIRRADLLGRLQAMERAQDLYSVLVDGAPIWPILRVQAGTTALRGSLMGFEAPPPLRTIQRSVVTVNALLQWNALRRIPSPEPLLFRTRRVYQAVTPLGTVDKFAHPLMVAAASTGWSNVLLHDGPMPHPPFPQQERIHVRRIDAWLRARSFVFSKRRSVPLAMLDPRVPALIHELVAIVGADGVEDLERAIHHFRLHLWNARSMLERIGPRHVFVTCWYASENMAMAHACHERGIPCTDMQHGVQGPAHLAYGAWHHLPAAGCSSIPSSFWCWDEASAQHIRSWAPEHAHLAYVGGSPWLEENAGAAPATPGTILFTMQPLMETIPPGLGHAIRNDGTDLTWVFRLHPNGMHMAGHVQTWAAQ
ncbi:MAG: hypothetical protein KDB84_08880, partial [Flavobacteriales bacterium]|nr:hypothetical protein [Flavobacteriales bacterium]